MKSSRTTRGLRTANQLSLLAVFALFAAQNSIAQQQQVLKIAADPNNLPFSNDHLEGFENKIAELIARELHYKIEYHWRAQRRGFFRETLKSGDVDVVLGVPSHFNMALTTAPYYRSTYVFVSRTDRNLRVASFDAPELRKLRIGVQLVGNDGVDTPPAHALAARGIVNNVIGFTLYGDYTRHNPPARIMDAVANGNVDIAVVWGPLAGYFAQQSKIPLEFVPVTPEKDGPLRFAFDVSLGVNKKEQDLRDQLDRFVTGHRKEIEEILDEYNVPRVPGVAKLTSAE
ncbi:MAG TPA: substrate-binding domain-containing protein [Candidatus Udaeobacter sp.]|jgi:mxaJ protein|nr:substrate-binding domain-containing protein [Candidatus Udaeobacter sp.]